MPKESLGTARCGRCAHILPDETMTYCLSCGIPFSRVPPTHQYQLLEERFNGPSYRGRLLLIQTLSWSLFFLACFMGGLFIFELQLTGNRAQLKALPDLEVYSYDFAGQPSAHPWVKKQALAYATQSFEDHFGTSFEKVSYFENQLPEEMGFLNTLEGREVSKSLSFWDEVFFKSIPLQNYAVKPLRVFMTNLPIYAEEDKSGIELSHLSRGKVVSGLGHPAFVVVSTFRMLTERASFHRAHSPVSSVTDQSRFMGEYVLAHELGHALLGLRDHVFESKLHQGFRNPAEDLNFEECLMHSDRGGGFLAWKRLRARPIGVPSKCKSYAAMTEAFRIRAEAIRLLKQGKRAEAEALHWRAIELARGTAQGWVSELWKREHPMFQTVVRRWINALFMIKSRNDSS